MVRRGLRVKIRLRIFFYVRKTRASEVDMQNVARGLLLLLTRDLPCFALFRPEPVFIDDQIDGESCDV